MFDLRFTLQVVVFCTATFGGVLAYLSPDVRAAVATALVDILPVYEEDMPPEKIKDDLDRMRKELRTAYGDIGPYWKVGRSIVPSSPDDTSPPAVPSMPYGPFFLPIPSPLFAEVAKEDFDYSRFKRRKAVLEALLALNEERCSAALRRPLLKAFKRYQVHFYHSIAYEKPDIPHYYATINDQHLAGLLYGLVWKGYLTWDDLPRPPFAAPFQGGFGVGRAGGIVVEREFKKRRACNVETG